MYSLEQGVTLIKMDNIYLYVIAYAYIRIHIHTYKYIHKYTYTYTYIRANLAKECWTNKMVGIKCFSLNKARG